MATKTKRTLKEKIAANKRAEASAKRVADMTEAERRKELAEIDRQLADHAPSLKAARSDLLRMLQVVGAEFVRRYYPDAEHASFYLSRYHHSGPPQYYISLPIPIVTKGDK